MVALGWDSITKSLVAFVFHGVLRMAPEEKEDRRGGSSRNVQRRDVMKAVGATALGSAAFAGTASAHEVDSVNFCGCGRLVARGDVPGPYEVTLAKEGRGGTDITTIEAQSEVGGRDVFVFVQRGRGKILSITIDGTTYCNPNQCAQNILDETDEVNCDTTGEKGYCRPQ